MITLDDLRILIDSLDMWVEACVLPVEATKYSTYLCMTNEWRNSYYENKYWALMRLVKKHYKVLYISSYGYINNTQYLLDLYLYGKSNKSPLIKGTNLHNYGLN